MLDVILPDRLVKVNRRRTPPIIDEILISPKIRLQTCHAFQVNATDVVSRHFRDGFDERPRTWALGYDNRCR